MRSFLGVPIVSPDGTIIGAFYLTEKEDADTFDAEDQELIELLAAHASIAITNARLYEQQPRAVDPVRAQPAGARAPRRGQPEAVQRDAHRRGRRHADGSRPGGRPGADRAAARARAARRSTSCAR